jgi:4-alpha-glucanotransferase
MARPDYMTMAQKVELLAEWGRCSDSLQRSLLEEFHRQHHGEYDQNDFLQFLLKKLIVEGYSNTQLFC